MQSDVARVTFRALGGGFRACSLDRPFATYQQCEGARPRSALRNCLAACPLRLRGFFWGSEGSRTKKHRRLSQRGQGTRCNRWTSPAHMLVQKPCRPEFVRITQPLGLAAGPIDDECPRFAGDDRLAPWTSTCRRHASNRDLERFEVRRRVDRREIQPAALTSSNISPLISRATSDAGIGFWHSLSGFSQKFEPGSISNRFLATAPRHTSGSLM